MLASTYACERARVDHFTTCAFKFEYEDMMAFALASVTYVYESALARLLEYTLMVSHVALEHVMMNSGPVDSEAVTTAH